MEVFSLPQLVMIIQALRVYEGHLGSKLDRLTDDSDECVVTADEMGHVKELLL